MTLRPSEYRASGVRTFYVASDSRLGTEYSVQHIRKPGMNRWQCSCPQFFYRCVARRRHCKHIRFVRCGTVVPTIGPSEVRA
jgi:hypothetical protein